MKIKAEIENSVAENRKTLLASKKLGLDSLFFL